VVKRWSTEGSAEWNREDETGGLKFNTITSPAAGFGTAPSSPLAARRRNQSNATLNNSTRIKLGSERSPHSHYQNFIQIPAIQRTKNMH